MTSDNSGTKKFLIAYNSISASLWSIIFFNAIFLGLTVGQPYFFDKTNKITTIIQCFAVIEIYNSLVGNVKSPVFTTVVQVLSRLLIVLGVCQALPLSPANYHWSYITLNLSWSITEIVRYSYYTSNLQDSSKTPKALTWARYSLFYVLYPTGVTSEITMVYLSLHEAELQYGQLYSWFLKAILVIYIPGFYVMYTHMIRQRKKTLGKVFGSKKTD